MKKIIAAALCLASLAFILCSCSNGKSFSDGDNLLSEHTRSTDTDKTFNYADGALQPPNEYEIFAGDVTEFTLRMFRSYNSTQDGTYVFSPVSAALQLGLAANGASGETRDEILSAVGKNTDLDTLNESFSYFKSRIQAVASANQESEADGDETLSRVKLGAYMLVNDTSDIKSKFVQTDADYYGTDIFRFMFSDENSLTKVNSLFSDFKTDSALEKLDKNQTLVSATASDVCDVWLRPYTDSDIEKGSFKAESGDRELTYMTSSETYMKTDSAQAIIKYTSKTPLKLMAILPNEDIALDDYISDFTSAELSKLFDSVDFSRNANAVLPEFSIDSGGSAKDITEVLEKSGMYSLFTDLAEFNNLTRSDGFKFNAMYELTPKFSLNSSGIGGVEAIGGGSLLSERTEEPQTPEVTVKFDRPFIFLVLDNESNIPLFAGVYAG